MPKAAPSKNLAPALAPPKHFARMYNAVAKMRARVLGPVDIIGCHMLADKTADKETQRWQTLVALMLSSQTRDQMTARAMKNLQSIQSFKQGSSAGGGGFTVAATVKASENTIREAINCTSFYNNKAKYIKATAATIVEEHDGKVPRAMADLRKLSGVGRKMSVIFKECADDEVDGLSCDVHMIRQFPLFGWVPKNCKTPDQVMDAAEERIPEAYYRNINEICVGFGQTVCPAKESQRCCDSCLARHSCPAAPASAKKKPLNEIEDLEELHRLTQPIRDKLKQDGFLGDDSDAENFVPPDGERIWTVPRADDESARSAVQITTNWGGERKKRQNQNQNQNKKKK